MLPAFSSYAFTAFSWNINFTIIIRTVHIINQQRRLLNRNQFVLAVCGVQFLCRCTNKSTLITFGMVLTI